MTKAIFTTKIEPAYDDLPEVRYHFPKKYLRAAQESVGDWIVYYEPSRTGTDRNSRGGRLSYFATARVTKIEKDERLHDHFYAFVSDYLEFDRPVPFREGDFFYENDLRRHDGRPNQGVFRNSVRTISDQEYDLILNSGFGEITLFQNNREPHFEQGLSDEPPVFERPILEQITRRPFRDAAFSKQVKTAYEETCAFTGIRLVNGGGRSEVHAAHIRPVADDGPDSVRNGLALSQTVHWMFDRGLVSIDDDYSILLAKDRIPDPVVSLFNADGRLRIPASRLSSPHPQFLHYHRKEVFKG